MRYAAALLSFLTAVPCLAGKFHDDPPGGGGGITVAVRPIERLEEAILVEPVEYKAYLARIDKSQGTITVSGIPPGKYDLVLKFDSVVAEGLTLDVPGGYEKLSKSDKMGIGHVTWITDDYFNLKRIARVGGNSKIVKLLVEQVRDKKTHEPDGTVLKDIQIRRLELTEMRKTGKIWTIKQTKWLFREERKMHDGGKVRPGVVLDFLYDPGLGGIRVGDEMKTLPPIDLAKLKDHRKPYFYRAKYVQPKYADEIRREKGKKPGGKIK